MSAAQTVVVVVPCPEQGCAAAGAPCLDEGGYVRADGLVHESRFRRWVSAGQPKTVEEWQAEGYTDMEAGT